jgi:hypothetical protein
VAEMKTDQGSRYADRGQGVMLSATVLG